jgi:putative flippase GtrA
VRQLGRYVLTGGTAAVVDLGGFVALVASGLPVPVAAALSFLLANVANYLLTARFVFGAAPTLRRYPLFLAAASAGFAVNVAVTALLPWALGVAPAAAKLAGIGVAFGANFLLNAGLVFPANRKARDPGPP